MARETDISEALGGFDPATHHAEAEQRWGDTDAWRESSRRTASYSADDWRSIRGEEGALTSRLADCFADDLAPDAAAVLEAAEGYRAHVSRWYYECTPEIQRGLGEMYVTDPRFTAHWEGDDPELVGFAAWVRDAFAANADRLGSGEEQ